jgi:hypothetical protein
LAVLAVSEYGSERVRDGDGGNAERVRRRCLCGVSRRRSLLHAKVDSANSPCPAGLKPCPETPAQVHLRQSAPIPLPAYRWISTPVARKSSLASGHVSTGSFHPQHTRLHLPFPCTPCTPDLRVSHATSYQISIRPALFIIDNNLPCLSLSVFNYPRPLLQL